LVASETSGFDSSSIFFTDGSKGGAGAGFGVYHSGGPESSFRLRGLSGVFTSEMSAIFVALIQIRAHRPVRYLFVTDSMSSLKTLQTRRVAPRTHSLVNEIKEACWWLNNNEYEIHMMWIPSHVGIKGNERADQLKGDAVENGIEWHAPVHPSDFLPLSRVRLLEGWQSGWDGSDMGKYAYSVWPVVSFMPWFRRFDGDQVIIFMINRMMANHSCLRSHLERIGMVESPMCVCLRDYALVEHVVGRKATTLDGLEEN
jgi:ribonuclease HI